MGLYPPRPSNISIPAVVAGNILQNDDTSISAIDNGFDGSVVIKTQNTLAMLINPQQRVSINTEAIDSSMFTINNDTSSVSTFRMSFQDSFYFDGHIAPNGNAVFIPSCDDVLLNPDLSTEFRKNFNVVDHDGMTKGLRLGGTLITASASEINYIDVPAGVGFAYKALVLDDLKNISGINQLSATSIVGTLINANQPNITTLNNISISGTLSIRGTPFTLTSTQMSYLQVASEGIAYESHALIVNSFRNISNINALSAATIGGTLTTPNQPNIRTLGIVENLNATGNIYFTGSFQIEAPSNQLKVNVNSSAWAVVAADGSGAMILKSSSREVKIDNQNSLNIVSHNGTTTGLYLNSVLVSANATQLNACKATAGVAEADRALILDSDLTVRGVNVLSANALFGTLQTGPQPNIIRVNTLNVASHDGSVVGLSLGGTLITATATELNYVDTTVGTAQPSKALIIDSSKNITGINALTATSITGVITTPTQPNINKVNTLSIVNHNGTTGLTLGGTLVTATAAQLNRLDVGSGTVAGEKAIIADGALNLVGFNNLGCATIAGTLTTAAQPNINRVNTLHIANHDGTKGLSLNGTLVTASAVQLNRLDIDAGTSNANKAVVLNASLSVSGINTLTASNLGGTLITPYQPNVTVVDVLNINNHNGSTSGLQLNETLVTSQAYQLNYVNVDQGVAYPAKAMILDADSSIRNIRSLSADMLTGVIQTSEQPKIESVNRLNITQHNGSNNGLSLNGTLITATAQQINRLNTPAGVAEAGKVLICDDLRNITNINILYATSIVGTINTSSQPNIKIVQELDIAAHDATTKGLSIGGTLIRVTAEQFNRLNVSAGVGTPEKVMTLNSQGGIANITSLTATKITGELQTGSQPNIVSVKTLNITDHNGTTGLQLNGALVQATAAQLNRIITTPGTASAGRVMMTDEFNSITGINNISATKLIAQQLSLSGVVANFNTGNLIAKSYSFTDFVGRMIDIQLIPSLSFSNFTPGGMSSGYSTEIIGYLNPLYSETFTFFVTCSDRVRLWVNGTLILHSWVKSSQARGSTPIFLNQGQWVPIYIQYQVDANSTPLFLLEWQSNSFARTQIDSSRFAWDNNPPAVNSKQFTQNEFTIYNTTTTAANTARFVVDTSGDLTIDASGNDITLGTADSINIPAHNGSTAGLYLGGVLVEPTAYELNALKVSPGTVTQSHAMVVDASSSISGINSLTATSIACTNLTTSAFTINNLSLSGPLNNYNSGSLLIRQITGPDVNGRVVDVNTINNINLTNYDPKNLNTNFSLDIIGYILPTLTDTHYFHAIANDRVRIWVNNVLILNLWDTSIGTESTSLPIALVAGQWTPIYIQFQNIIDSSMLQVRWSASTLVKSYIPSGSMAWDNTISRPIKSLSAANSVSIFSASSGLNTVRAASMAVSSNGDLTIASGSTLITIPTDTNFNIAGHNGTTTGLQLSGAIVKATASELNYLAGATPGSVVALKAIVLDTNKALSGFSSLSSDEFVGQIKTANQPLITSFGTLSATLNTSSDILINSTNLLRFASDATACYIQAGSSTTSNSAADLFIGNYGATIAASTRKLMIKSTGFVGIQTTAPTRALSINGAGAAFCLRLINNNTGGTETAFCDLGVDSSSAFRIGTNVSIGPAASATVLSVNASGVMNITPSSGSLQIGNSVNAALPLEVGASTFTLSSVVGYMNASGSSGIATPAGTSYSIRTTGSIVVGGTVCVTSDRRLKENINPLSYNDCKQFILDSNPVRFNYKSDDTPRCGLIAQDVLNSDFAQLVKAAPHEGLAKEVAEDGCVSPENAALNVSYEEIIPILMATMKETMKENDILKSQVQSMMARLSAIESKIAK